MERGELANLANLANGPLLVVTAKHLQGPQIQKPCLHDATESDHYPDNQNPERSKDQNPESQIKKKNYFVFTIIIYFLRMLHIHFGFVLLFFDFLYF